jgi:hypothetical protein
LKPMQSILCQKYSQAERQADNEPDGQAAIGAENAQA